MTLSEPQIRELVERARQGSDEAVEALIGGLRARMVRWATVITGDVDDAEDVTQKVSLKLQKELQQYGERARFSTWLYSVVRNAALDWRRQARYKHDDDALQQLAATTEDALQRIHEKAMAERVRAFFRDLPPRQRELIEMIDQQGFTAAEAAVALGIDDATARVHLMKARRTLRAKMMEEQQ